MLNNNSKLHLSGLRLSLSVAAAVLITTIVFVATKHQREYSSQAILSNQLAALLPKGAYDNNPATDSILVNKSVSNNLTVNRVYLYKMASTVGGAVLHVTTSQGYSGDIELLIALAQNTDLHGVAVIAHTETPGLGDKIEQTRSDWLLQFSDLRTTSMPESAWAVKRDGGEFDQITGATITPRAVINAVSDTINWYSNNVESLR